MEPIEGEVGERVARRLHDQRGAQLRERAPRAAPAKPAAEARPRFGIGSLINRMAGGSGGAEAAPQAGRPQPGVGSFDEDQELSPDQERIEIPAFLRRQAN